MIPCLLIGIIGPGKPERAFGDEIDRRHRPGKFADDQGDNIRVVHAPILGDDPQVIAVNAAHDKLVGIKVDPGREGVPGSIQGIINVTLGTDDIQRFAEGIGNSRRVVNHRAVGR